MKRVAICVVDIIKQLLFIFVMYVYYNYVYMYCTNNLRTQTQECLYFLRFVFLWTYFIIQMYRIFRNKPLDIVITWFKKKTFFCRLGRGCFFCIEDIKLWKSRYIYKIRLTTIHFPKKDVSEKVGFQCGILLTLLCAWFVSGSLNIQA